MKRILMFLGIEYVIDIEPHFEDQRLVQRGKKQILQKFIEGNYAMDDHWQDIKQIN
jgi:hypothetical protein